MIHRRGSKLLGLIEFLFIFVMGKSMGISLVVRYLRNPNPYTTVRLLRSFGATIGARTTFKRSLFIDNTYEDEHSAGDFKYLKVGHNCYIGDSVYFDLSNEILIKDNVVVSGQVSFVTHADCNRSKYLSQKFPRRCEPVTIESGAWLGFGATILSGVIIGKDSVVGAKSLVKENVQSATIYSGVPARKTRDLTKEPGDLPSLG
jgi:acetyltransferase-like isoleucine patch superfamily enzyme